MFFTDVIDINETNLLREYPEVLHTLLMDKTAGRYLLWCTDDYVGMGEGYQSQDEMLPERITVANEGIIKSRCMKDKETQIRRIRSKGEVFTPAWLCNKMNNVVDKEWFGRDAIFNNEGEKTWTRIKQPKGFMPFPDKKTNEPKSWQSYIKLKRLEITCGEAPYLTSRYDMVEGEKIIPVMERIGLLDRKMQVIHQRVKVGNKANWLKYAKMALQSIYGYDWQGDNVMLARENLLMDMIAFYQYKFHEHPEPEVVQDWAEIIAWNIWQMDGLKYVIPNSCHKVPVNCGLDGFGDTSEGEMEPCPGCKHNKYNVHNGVYCKIMDWEKNESFEFRDLVKEGGIMPKKADFKFDVIIGNPPYQDVTIGDNETYQPPVYHLFLEASYGVADIVEMVHPARFLFNAGSTPKDWNKKMLNDEHIKIVHYDGDSSNVFLGTDIKGGVAVSYRNSSIDFGCIGVFTPHKGLNSIIQKVCNRHDFNSFSGIVLSRTSYRLTNVMHKDYPNAKNQLSNGHLHDMSTNIFERLPQIFYDKVPDSKDEYCLIVGREDSRRVSKYIKRKYINDVKNFDNYKVLLPKAYGTDIFGESFPEPEIYGPKTGSTETFISIGFCRTHSEASNLAKYIKTKFTRAMLGVLKVTQDITPEKWAYVPLQDFTSKSDIDWSKPVAEIDKQLYKKYKLSKEEIEFIESHVKEMK